MKKRTVSIATALLEELGRAVRRWRHEGAAPGDQPPIFAIDPGSGGSRPTGWCLICDDGSILSGEGDPDVVVAEAGAALDIAGRIVGFAREQAFTQSRAQMAEDETITPATLYRMGLAAGRVTGGLDYGAGLRAGRRFAGAVTWEPMPNTWRAVLGLNRANRDETADAVWRWARATTGLPLVTPAGRRRVDQAMSIGIAHAMLDITLDAERRAS